MSIEDILGGTKHRPWPLLNKKWAYYQEWNNVLFLHYQVSLSELEKFVPKHLEIDLFAGSPWISVVVFTMEKVRLKNLPYFPPISNFHEINIRTYVKFNNKPGVFFLSIEGEKLLSCKIAKAISNLPYRYSCIIKSTTTCQSKNELFGDQLKLTFEIGAPKMYKNDLDLWLTERYALFQNTINSINTYDIHHLEWPLSELKFQQFEVDYPRYKKLFQEGPELVHFSKGVQVLAWKMNKVFI
ncbi:YqjF family protein [Flagellimonas aequoris]|uniref:DUF2071 domain-containing protein n=1 Tax=Flagellimonas aequoris TaxID=2306997 RepID=A0A418N9P4_9FLAO|nr:DUF2071 domain-containing protein [Allomuricauda aequoris]RIV72590.1 DUF2071 domain-containing protein [Allomuricauda aequoris]TXK05090.1 DUF2071 domain-containing protein [Allomuricauda aequoris]